MEFVNWVNFQESFPWVVSTSKPENSLLWKRKNYHIYLWDYPNNQTKTIDYCTPKNVSPTTGGLPLDIVIEIRVLGLFNSRMSNKYIIYSHMKVQLATRNQ